MIFDRMIQIVEKHRPADAHLLRRAKLFEFPGIPHRVLNREIGAEEAGEINREFFLPFQHVAIEDKASCTLIWQAKPDVQGLGTEPFEYLDCIPLDTPESAEAMSNLRDDEDKAAWYRFPWVLL